MKIKVSEASGPVLDWMVAKCESERTRYQDYRVVDGQLYTMFCDEWLGAPYEPSTDWSRGGPIIDREFIHLLGWRTKSCDKRVAFLDTEAGSFKGLGPTGLIAGLRCYVASKLGEEVDVPEELI